MLRDRSYRFTLLVDALARNDGKPWSKTSEARCALNGL
jgi:hypothetical protein